MKILDPQSALITHIELQQFLASTPLRNPEVKKGAYENCDLSNLKIIRQDLSRYNDEIVPYTARATSSDSWMRDLISRLKPYDLTKSEVLNLIDIGVGRTRSGGSAQVGDMDVDQEQQTDTADEDLEVGMARDVLFFKCAVEECEVRFPDETEQMNPKIEEIISIFRDAITDTQGQTAKNTDVNGHSQHD